MGGVGTTNPREPSWASEAASEERLTLLYLRKADDGGRKQRAGGWSKLERGGLIRASATCQPPVAQWRVPRGPEHEAGEAVLPTGVRQSQVL